MRRFARRFLGQFLEDNDRPAGRRSPSRITIVYETPQRDSASGTWEGGTPRRTCRGLLSGIWACLPPSWIARWGGVPPYPLGGPSSGIRANHALDRGRGVQWCPPLPTGRERALWLGSRWHRVARCRLQLAGQGSVCVGTDAFGLALLESDCGREGLALLRRLGLPGPQGRGAHPPVLRPARNAAARSCTGFRVTVTTSPRFRELWRARRLHLPERLRSSWAFQPPFLAVDPPARWRSGRSRSSLRQQLLLGHRVRAWPGQLRSGRSSPTPSRRVAPSTLSMRLP